MVVKHRKTELSVTNKIETFKKVARFHTKMLLLKGSKDSIVKAKYILELRKLDPKQFLNDQSDLKIVKEWLDSLPAVSENVEKLIEEINAKI